MNRLFTVLFFLLLLLIGFFSYQSYGISWDEPAQHDIGMLTYNYVTGIDSLLLSDPNRFYNLNIEFLLYLPEKWLHLHSASQIYLSRHIGTYLFFWIGTIFLFLLAKKLFRSAGYGFLAIFILMLTPRIFAHAFINSKDIPLLTFCTISIYALICFLEKPTIRSGLLSGLASGFTTAIRPVGLLLFALAIAFFLLALQHKKFEWKKIWLLPAFLFVAIASYYVFQPALWKNPVSGFEETWSMMSHFPFKAGVLFMGEMWPPGTLPWYYVPVWIGITVPVLWIITFIAGVIFFFFRLTKMKFHWAENWQWLLILCWLFFPWIAVLLFHSVIYDEWRHLFFIYPAFILFSLLGIQSIANLLASKNQKLRAAWFAVLIIYGGLISTWMIENHPYENVFFNSLAGKDVYQKYELDYWGTSYRQALEYLVHHDSSAELKVHWENDPCEWNLSWLSKADSSRIHEVPADSCTYFITNYRLHPELFQSQLPRFYSKIICGNEIMTIFKGSPGH